VGQYAAERWRFIVPRRRYLGRRESLSKMMLGILLSELVKVTALAGLNMWGSVLVDMISSCDYSPCAARLTRSL
jgi:hypothetical protein